MSIYIFGAAYILMCIILYITYLHVKMLYNTLKALSQAQKNHPYIYIYNENLPSVLIVFNFTCIFHGLLLKWF